MEIFITKIVLVLYNMSNLVKDTPNDVAGLTRETIFSKTNT